MAITRPFIIDLFHPETYVTDVLQQNTYQDITLEITITQDSEVYTIPSGVTVRIDMNRFDGTKVSDNTNCSIFNNKVKVTVTPEMTAVAGRASIKLVFIDSATGGNVQTVKFHLLVQEAIIQDSQFVSSNEFPLLQDAILRVEDMEAGFDGYQTEEATRVSNENTRISNENTRISHENTRISSESTRVSNESTRQSSESSRVSAESNRVSAESTRVSSENTRISNENTRQSNESTRQSQETSRQTNTTTAINNANDAADNANEIATQLANETLIIWKTSVSSYSAIASTYPTPALGWTTQANDTKIRWRYDGTQWVNIGTDATDKVGDLTSLNTESKTNAVAAINDVVTQLASIVQQTDNNSVANTLRKLKQGQKIKIGLFGDSLVDGAGGTPYWYKLLFDEAQRSSGHSLLYDFNLPANYITYDNYAVGGSTPDLMLSHVIPMVTSKKGGFTGGQISDQLHTNPPAISKQYDIVFIDGGYNGGLFTALMIEEITRRFIEVGTEVILISSQNGQWLTAPPSYQSDYYKIAKHYGCKLIDFHALYSVDRAYADTHYYADSIHQSAEGHVFWADTIRNFLNTNMANNVGKSLSGVLPATRLFYFNESNRLAQSNYACFFVNMPSETNGTLGNAVTGDGIKNPLVSQGLSQYYELGTGQYAQFGFDDAVFIIPVYGGDGTTATVQYYPNGAGSVQATLSIMPGNSGYTTAWTKNTVSYDVLNGYGTFANSYYAGNRLLKLIVTANTIKLLGCIVFTEPNIALKNSSEVLPKGVSNIGTWGLTAWQTIDNYFNTVTNGDSVKIDFVGTSLETLFGFSNGGGLIDVYIDGVNTTTIDTYRNQAGLGFETRKVNTNVYGKHTIELKVNGANASAQTPVLNVNPRLAWRKFMVIDGRQNITERLYLLKKWYELAY